MVRPPPLARDLRGWCLIVRFLFTSCSLGCREVHDRTATLQRVLAEAEDVLLNSFTVGPRTETPRDADPLRLMVSCRPTPMVVLTGEKPAVYRLLETSFLSRMRALEGIIPGGFVNMGHIILVDRAGQGR